MARMAVATLLAAALVDLGIALTLLFVGWRVWRRTRSPSGARAAAAAFATWWVGLAVTVLANALRELVAGLGLEGASFVPGFALVLHLALVAGLVASVWGLLYYLVYVFSGRRGAFWPLAAFYAAYGAVAAWLVWGMRPDGFVPGKWFVGWSYAKPTVGGPLLVVMTLLLLLPQLGSAAAYGTLWFRAPEGAMRRRVALVSVALIVWLGSSLVAPFLQLGRFEWWQAGGRLVGLAASLVILYAYVRLPDVQGPLPAPARSRDEALMARVRELV